MLNWARGQLYTYILHFTYCAANIVMPRQRDFLSILGRGGAEEGNVRNLNPRKETIASFPNPCCTTFRFPLLFPRASFCFLLPPARISVRVGVKRRRLQYVLPLHTNILHCKWVWKIGNQLLYTEGSTEHRTVPGQTQWTRAGKEERILTYLWHKSLDRLADSKNTCWVLGPHTLPLNCTLICRLTNLNTSYSVWMTEIPMVWVKILVRCFCEVYKEWSKISKPQLMTCILEMSALILGRNRDHPQAFHGFFLSPTRQSC